MPRSEGPRTETPIQSHREDPKERNPGPEPAYKKWKIDMPVADPLRKKEGNLIGKLANEMNKPIANNEDTETLFLCVSA